MNSIFYQKFDGPTATGVRNANWASEQYPITPENPTASGLPSVGKVVVAAALGLATTAATWSAISPQVPVPTAMEFRGSIARNGIAEDVDDRRDLLDKLRTFTDYEDNWDGYGGKAAASEAVRDASAFIRQLPIDVAQPDPQLSGDGEISLIWDMDAFFIDVGFYGNGRMAYYVDTGGNGEFFGQAVPVADGIPHDISKALISATV